MTGTGLLAATRIILLCLTAYFGVAYSIVKALEMFTVYIPFSGAMADGGVYSRQDHRRLLTGRWIPLLVILLLSSALTAYLAWRTLPVGACAAGICLVLGVVMFLRGSRDRVVLYQRFVRQYRDFMDKEKFCRVLESKYGMTLPELSSYKGGNAYGRNAAQ